LGGTVYDGPMRPAPARTAFALLLLLASSAPSTPAQTSGGSQKARAEGGVFSIPIEIREQYLGKSGSKTVVKFTLVLSRAELASAVNAAPRTYSFFLNGEVKTDDGATVDTFRVPIDVDLSDVDVSKPLQASFLQPLQPGSFMIQFGLEGVAGKLLGTRNVSLVVPAMTSEFRAEDAGLGSSDLPSASAVILESENRPVVPKGTAGLVKILAPRKEVPIGLLRVECEVSPPVTRVEFWLEDKRILVKNRPPYTVELDLGKIPRKQTLKAVGFDAQGNFLDSDAWAINERDARLAVRLLELPRKPDATTVDLKVTVQSIAGGVARSVKLYLDTDLVKEWGQPPFTVTVDAARMKKATLIRATALDDEGKEFSDIKLLKGESRFLSRVEVNLVELHVSVYEPDGRFAKGLKKDDFTVLEDGVPQEISAFEFAEALPITLGIVIDGSGSMREAMPLVHEAASEFVNHLVSTEKDQGFVIEFREAPVVLASLTHKPADLIRAIRETHASGGTALYDSAVMALYQFRAIPGRKAIVILTDGADNHSWTDYETLRRYARTSGIPIYFIGLNMSIVDVGIKSKMKELAVDTGAEAFFPSAKGLAEIYRKIETELRSQYFISYLTNSKKGENEFRTMEVRPKNGKLKVRTIRGYFP
jgi:Ca-activated chloride channel family protein